MAAGNNVDLIGNITRDPEARATASGMTVVTFGLAVNRRTQDRNTQEWKESTSFFDVVCYGTLGDNVAESLQKGARIMVVGRLEQRSWETPDGDKRSKVEVIADEVGPSLRWATAEVTRNARSDSGGGGFSGGGGGGAARPVRNQPAESYDYDEEPF